MPAFILKGDGFVGITDDRRREIKEAMAAADAMGVLPDDPEKRKLIIERLDKRLAKRNKGWGFQKDGTVVRVDDRGIARVIPQSEGIGFLPGTMGGRAPESGEAVWKNIPDIVSIDPRTAASRFYQRIRLAMEKQGYIPADLRRDMIAEGWREGQPISQARIEQWCSDFQTRFDAKKRNNVR